ncbi:MAG TPA: T9SS type A sorting domain-containing protein, partial [Rubricoccaceae bacterium]
GPRTQRPTGTINPNFRRGAHVRRNAQTNLFNSVILGFTPGILIDGATSNAGTGSGSLDIEGTLVSGSVTDNLGTNGADTGAALAFFTGQPGNSALASDAAASIGSVVVAAESGPLAEAGFRLAVAPNPSAGGMARLTISVPEATAARLAVYDVLGREVAVVADETLAAGEHTVALGQRLPAGVYIARLQTSRGGTAVQFTVVR